MRKATALLFAVVLALSTIDTFLPVKAQSSGWEESTALVKGLPPLGKMGENSQEIVFNLKGNGRWNLIIGPCNGWTANEYPFMGYYWDGSQWTSDSSIVNGLVARCGLNHPTVGFNVSGDNMFDMIVSGNPYMSSPGWSGYSWDGARWVEKPALLAGLPNYGTGNNFATLGYNLLGNGKWDLIVDNSGNNGYVGFEWNGTSWIPQNSLVNGLPMAESVGPGHKFPAPYFVSDFEGKTTLFVGLSSGGPLTGNLEAFQWDGKAWVPDYLLTLGVNDLLPWPNTPTVAYNVTGNNQWILLVGSASGFVDRIDYYRGYYWTGRSPVTIAPLSAMTNVGIPVTFTASMAGNALPFNYQWYVDDHLMSSVVSSSNTNSWSYIPTENALTSHIHYVSVKVTDSNGFTSVSLKAEVTVFAAGVGIANQTSGGNSTIPVLLVSCQRSPTDSNFTLQITGNLTAGGAGLAGAPVLLSYSRDYGNSWNQLAWLNTDNVGSFALVWNPPEEGNFLLQAMYPGSMWYTETSTIVNFWNTPILEQQVFSIQTNSTLSAFSFNSSSNKLSFSVSGPFGSTGYVNLRVAKNLIGNVSDLQVYLDGEELSYITESVGDSWLIYFNYYHSVHTVTIDLGSVASQKPSNELPIWWLPVVAVLSVAVVCAALLVYFKKRKR